ncbi:MAG: type IIL restriction-modification enzyme MmeI, partial [Burkholderiales bacterium]
RRMPHAMKVIDSVRRYRLGEIPNKSGSREAKDKPESTKVLAVVPTRFHVENLPIGEVLVLPRHSSESRSIIPMGYFGPDVLIGDACLVLNGVSLLHFGVLCSKMHNAWSRSTCGRIKSDFRYSAEIVYNNFPWPDQATDKQVKAIEVDAQGVLDARAEFPRASLADLYDPLTMPPALVRAHHKLDAAVDAAYGKRNFRNDAERVAFLFELYRKYTSLLPAAGKPAAKRKAAKKRPA